MKKHIVCFGDSNTHGYCAVPSDCSDGGSRFNENERWTCLLQKDLGEEYLVLEEGLCGRTTVFNDPLEEGLSGLDVLTSVLMSHEPIDLLILMLGTNDTKDRFAANATCIGLGMERLIVKAKNTPCWNNGVPHILVVSPPHIREGLNHSPVKEVMGNTCVEKSKALAQAYRMVCAKQGCMFMDAEGIAEFNLHDCMHLTKKGHAQLAQALKAQITAFFSA